MNAYRIATFFAPSFDHPLWQAGSQWLGRDARGRDEDPVSCAERLTDSDLTDAPRRYGFHATLKPPFVLTSGDQAVEIAQAARAIAAEVPAFRMPALSVKILDGFLALRPARHDDQGLHNLNQLAESMVRGLDRFRQPTSPEQITQRAGGLSAQQQNMLEQWGYPFVLETWRFHMTLSRRLIKPTDRPETALAAARAFFEPAIKQPLWCRDVCLYLEPAPESDFVCWQRIPLSAA